MTPTVRVKPLTALLLAAGVATLASGCGVAPPVVNTGIDCSSYGGCDVLEDFTTGGSTIIPLRASTFLDANTRARQDSLRADVLDASVVGHNPPHIALSNLYFHRPTPS